MLARLMVLLVVLGAFGCGRAGGAGAGGDADDAGDAGPCQGTSCTQMGCNAVTGLSGSSQLVVGFSVSVAAPMGDLTGSAVRGCRNDACVTGTLLSPQDSPSGWNWVRFPTNDSGIEANVRSPVALEDPVLEVGWGRNTDIVPWSPVPPPEDGDRYSVEMTTPGGVVVAAASGTATYVLNRPNGPCCEPACRVGTFTMTPDAGVER